MVTDRPRPLLALAKTTNPLLASWDEWSPHEYLADYYRVVEPDEVETIRFIVEAAKRLPANEPILIFGSGPTLHHVFPIAPYASELHVADYLPANLDEISAWLNRRPPFHDWRPFVRYALICEGMARPSEAAIATREELTRRKIAELLQADAGRRDPLGLARRAFYPTVISCYCADLATNNKVIWRRYMANISSLLEPGGTFITAALRRATFYKVGARYFPSADVDEQDLRGFLDQELGRDVLVETRSLPEHAALGYTGIVLGHGVKRR